VAEWSKAPNSSSGLRKGAWVQIPLLTIYVFISNHQMYILFKAGCIMLRYLPSFEMSIINLSHAQLKIFVCFEYC
ncbi:hypothetical protein LINPERPRIM_LOCUS15150, partial [Linum perenne]